MASVKKYVALFFLNTQFSETMVNVELVIKTETAQHVSILIYTLGGAHLAKH